ncbi:ATP synthase subunit b [Cardinium endosymbiont cEper1 of Encarsia pergandiella]|uniref:F0F1 ATP synthase subunit B n=1 Tax=Cardinium endosymbiont of Encarsia pergandiella TaxID=249402 RepID=UPI00027EAA10|nr:F0F1 ATP synthase subunit B [Cardinium endosymbiont of Encarsia pergandiella]CCM10478.1 ATP synthase subunit b [Cardinium endosymbiont cEper1 of Encarsia pergandiella]
MTLITPDFGIIFWQTITFLVVLLVLSKFAWRPILEILKAREDAVAHAVYKITEAKVLIKQLEEDRAKLIEEAHLERARIVGEALVTQRAIIDQAHQEALVLKERLLAEAKVAITREEERALETVKANVGSLVVQITEKLLVKELSQDSSQWALIERLMANKLPHAYKP